MVALRAVRIGEGVVIEHTCPDRNRRGGTGHSHAVPYSALLTSLPSRALAATSTSFPSHLPLHILGLQRVGKKIFVVTQSIVAIMQRNHKDDVHSPRYVASPPTILTRGRTTIAMLLPIVPFFSPESSLQPHLNLPVYPGCRARSFGKAMFSRSMARGGLALSIIWFTAQQWWRKGKDWRDILCELPGGSSLMS